MQPALVVIVNNRGDWSRVVDEGWYRIPRRSAPVPLAAELLAFYFTSPFGTDAYSVAYVAPIHSYRLVRRAELLPAEVTHARAGEWYFRVGLGPVARLERPVRSRRLRRVVFIPTSMEALAAAQDVSQLWRMGDEQALEQLILGAMVKGMRRPKLESANTRE